METGSVAGNQWVANQAGSSARQVEKMVLRELRSGDFSHLVVRIERIEQLVSGHQLRAEDERRLLLLGAEFLEAAGETRRAQRVVGTLLSDRDTLHGEFYADLRRFRTRLVLNSGDVVNARWEIDRIERVVTETAESFGAVKEVVDPDASLVSTETWLLETEVCVEEGDFLRASQCLASALREMRSGVGSVDQTAMFELLSAVLLLLSGDDSAVPAMAYLYRTYVGSGDDSVDSRIKGRIAAAVGDMQNVVGISESEVRRWRRHGPRYELVARFLTDESTMVAPVDFSAHLPVVQLAAVPAVSHLSVESDTTLVSDRLISAVAEYPMSFLFSAHGLEEIATHFDYHLKTGPVVIDWSQCDRVSIEEAIDGGAISDIALRSQRGVVYFNNGSYVDAVFEGVDRETLGVSVDDVLFELFRITMAGLPGAFGRQLASGPEAARVPEAVNYRPNSFNIDLMRRLDHLRSGGSLADIEDTDIDRAFDSWPSEAASAASSVVPLVETIGISDHVAEGDHVFVSNLLSLTEASSVKDLYEHLSAAIGTLGLNDPFLAITVAGTGEPLIESGGLPKDYAPWARSNGGPVCVELSLRSGFEANCRESVQLLLNAATQRLRVMPGTELAVKVEVPEFVAEDLVTQQLLSNLRHYAVLDGVNQPAKAILLTGERGTGKELLARALHNWSGRSGKAFRPVNFAGISKALGGAQIFGAKKGAYTGADTNKKGLIQEVEGGTLFLDELDEADENVQAMLKRLIQFGTYYQIGSPEELKADVRYVAATNVMDPESSIKRDLRDRFLEVRVPPLRERRADIRPLAQAFAAQHGLTLPDSVLGFLETLYWPGNVRQLQNVVERSCALVKMAENPGESLTLDLFEKSAIEDRARVVPSEDSGGEYAPLDVGETLKMRRRKVDTFLIRRILDECNGNLKHAAERLGITRPGLKERMKELGIPETR